MGTFYFKACPSRRTLRVVSLDQHEWLFTVPLLEKQCQA